MVMDDHSLVKMWDEQDKVEEKLRKKKENQYNQERFTITGFTIPTNYISSPEKVSIELTHAQAKQLVLFAFPELGDIVSNYKDSLRNHQD